MSKRLTAEREAFVRQIIAETDPRLADEADRIIAEILAELDVVRAERDEALVRASTWMKAATEYSLMVATPEKLYAMTDEMRATRVQLGLEEPKRNARAETAEAALAEVRDRAHAYRHAIDKYAGDDYFTAERRGPRMALDAALADTAAAAEAYRARIVEEATAPLRAEIDAAQDVAYEAALAAHEAKAERDTLAAALAEMRDAGREVLVALSGDGTGDALGAAGRGPKLRGDEK